MKTKIDQGGFAFPTQAICTPAGDVLSSGDDGMSLRDYFAGQALVGISQAFAPMPAVATPHEPTQGHSTGSPSMTPPRTPITPPTPCSKREGKVMGYGRAERKYFPGMERSCAKCSSQIIVTEQMCKHSKYVCSPCQSKAATDYARRNREKKRAWNNAYHAKISNIRAGKTKAYREANPEKRAAHQAVQTAVRNGSLARQVCSVCGSGRAHAHHEDYSKPLDVIWLCHAHHMERHSMLAARAKDR